ncbi:MAG: trypsin-like peptidase domain-containing protein [candidate division Zixibacteria bacterium]|nr:trypsin-like peptidase domain-containing protein [candidate division Zixibacteria bacterium]
MEQRFFPQTSKRKKRPRFFSLGIVAFVFTLCGILIAPHLRFADGDILGPVVPVSGAGLYPLVDRDGELESPFVSVVENVQDAVVNISARSREERVPWWYQGPNYSTSSGSGFFFREDGYILTNNHVIQDAMTMTVSTASGYQYEAKLVGADPQTDLAVLKVEPEEEITVIPFGDSDDIKVGDWAIAIGNPFPQQGLDRTVTVGVISAVGRSNLRFGRETPDYQNYIQTDASINPGNSGGPLLNLRGEAIGVNAAISSPTGGSVGIGFAIPITLARAVVPDLIATGKASRGWFGVWFHDVTQREAKRQGLDAVKGVTVDSVFAESPAEKAGVLADDIIVSFNNQPVDNAGRLSVLVSTASRDESTMPVEVVRDGETVMLHTIVTDRDAFLSSLAEADAGPDDFQVSVWAGMELLTFTPDIARAVGLKHVDGVYVRRVYPGSKADFASINRGTIILQVDDVPVKSLEDIEKVANELRRARRIPLIVQEPDGTIARKVIRP